MAFLIYSEWNNRADPQKYPCNQIHFRERGKYIWAKRDWLFSSTVYGSKWGGNYGMLHWHCQHFVRVSFQTLAVWNALLESAVPKANELSWAIRLNCLSIWCQVTAHQITVRLQNAWCMSPVWCLDTHYERSSYERPIFSPICALDIFGSLMTAGW